MGRSGWREGAIIGALAGLVAHAGCNVDFGYLIPAAAGQLKLLQQTVPIDQAIASGDLTDQQVAKLKLILDVRDYAASRMHLDVENNYTMFYDAGDQPVAINLSASRKDALAPKLWSFPIVGTVPYLGFFDPAAATKRRRQLESEDWDVFTYEIDAYSAVGFFPNPVLSPMLERDDVSLVDTIMHELLHGTVWRVNDTPFNESLATFVGRRGAESYFADRFPDQSDFIRTAGEQFEDVDRFMAFMLDLVEQLDAYYHSDLKSSAKITGRAALIREAAGRFERDVLPLMHHPEPFAWIANGLPVNNAWYLGIRRYNLDLDVFEQVFEATGRDWPQSISLFREAAADPAPYQYLREWLSGTTADTTAAKHLDHAPGAGLVLPTPERRPCELTRATTLIAAE